MKIAYFAYDLNDPAVERRVRMLAAGGAEVALAGFRRAEAPVTQVAGVAAMDLGQTHAGRLAHRAGLALRRALVPGRFRRLVAGADVVMARNLEMLVIALRARDAAAPQARLVYECLDIHRSMLGEGPPSRVLRAFERSLLARTDLLVVSSPAFVDAYFKPRQRLRAPVRLVENKVLDLDAPTARPPLPRPPGPPWRIGWFGVIRCRRSLQILADLARRNPDLVQVTIRGRPAYGEFDDFQAQVDATPNLSFAGPYRPEDLPGHYGGVHFTWAIDFFEQGLNSSWLLSNRLYEGALNGSVALAQAGVESGRWVAAHDAGVLLSDPLPDLEAFLRALTSSRYQAMADKVAAIPRDDLRADRQACRDLVAALAGAGA